MQMTSAKTAPLLALVLILPLTGCVSMTASSETKQALCDQFQPLRWSGSDTDETIKQAKEHNAVFVKLCRWKP